jgi:hypothetical protein
MGGNGDINEAIEGGIVPLLPVFILTSFPNVVILHRFYHRYLN